MTTQKAIAFTQRARATATRLEIAFRDAERLKEEWFALAMGTDVPFDDEPVEDGHAAKPITNMDLYGIVNRCEELTADYRGDNNAKLNTVLKLSEAPADWRQ